jgi:hypothetical protein
MGGLLSRGNWVWVFEPAGNGKQEVIYRARGDGGGGGASPNATSVPDMPRGAHDRHTYELPLPRSGML